VQANEFKAHLRLTRADSSVAEFNY
jgi:hypothetical protein